MFPDGQQYPYGHDPSHPPHHAPPAAESGRGGYGKMMTEAQLQASLITFLRQCLATTKSLPQHEHRIDALLTIERQDENFHKYAYIKYLHKRMDAALGPILDDHLKGLKGSTELDAVGVVPAIAEKIMASPDYINLVSTISEETKKLVSTITFPHQSPSSFTFQTPTPGHDNSNSRRKSSSYQNPFNESPFSSHSNTTYESGSTSISSDQHSNSGGFQLLYSDDSKASSDFGSGGIQIQRITAGLKARNSLDVRKAAMKKLDAIPTGDLLSSELWAETRTAIDTALQDPDVRIVMAGLRICARTFKASPPSMTAEVYLILVHHLINVFQSGNITKIGDGLNVSDPRTDCLLRKFRLLHQFQMELPSCWLRFPEAMFKDVMRSTFRLLRPETQTSGCLTSLYCMSLIDTHALWFEKWMISSIGRAEAVESMIKANFITDLVYHFLSFISTMSRESGTTNQNRPSDEVVVMDVDANDEEDGDLAKNIVKKDLEYIHFLHVLVILSRLLLFSAGRECFPIRVGNESVFYWEKALAEWGFGFGEIEGVNLEKHTLSMATLIQILINLMCSCANMGLSVREKEGSLVDDACSLNLSRFICKTIKFIANDDKCQEHLHKDEVITALIRTVKDILELRSPGGSTTSDEVLRNIAETLSNIAATDSGNRFLLRGKRNHKILPLSLRKSNRSDILTTVSEFVRQALEGHLRGKVSLSVIGAYIFFLRQLYRTCEGLSWVEGFSIHKLLARRSKDDEWVLAMEEGGMAVEEWQTISIDNLLNFAGTPKGVLLLQQSGAMDICVAHMFNRYEKKMQVSTREKFGYGVLVSQISTTTPGMQALQKSGLITSFFTDMWTALESDSPFGEAPLDPDDYGVQKIVNNILKAVSSFPGVSSILSTERRQDGDRAFMGVIGRMVLVDRRGFGESLVTFEESHQIGLRILRLLTSSLDSFFVLESLFSFQDSLLKLQEECRRKLVRNPRHDTYILDANSLLRNHILVATYVMGGPSERVLPPIGLDSPLPLQLFSSYPVPECYLPDIKMDGLSDQRDESLVENDDPRNPLPWLTSLRVKIDSLLHKKNRHISLPYLSRIYSNLTKAGKSIYEAKEGRVYCGWNSLNLPKPRFHDNEGDVSEVDSRFSELSLTVVARYLSRLFPNQDLQTIKRNLLEVLGRSQKIIHQTESLHPNSFQKPQAPQKSSPIPITDEELRLGFDWFTATIFAVFNGSPHPILAFLEAFSKFAAAMFLWPHFSLSVRSNADDLGGIPLIYSCSSHLVEAILGEELPSLFSAFTLSGCTPSQITQRWMREWYWNVLDFPEIINHLTLNLVCGVDYHIYFCIALLKHLERPILTAAREGKLITYLNEAGENSGDVSGFEAGRYVGFMRELEEKYRETIFEEMHAQISGGGAV
ncbi:hypothetical protein HDU67_006913 [Dinochytrium kinnereticum]|nr:hypothetical protein HDU67_006913 [Dinochytrium kinnereticum]